MPNWIIEEIGKKEYIELLKKHNLTTKKWTYGRTKDFYKEIKKILKEKRKIAVRELEEVINNEAY